MNKLTLNDIKPPIAYKHKRLHPKRRLTIEYWLSPEEETFGNLYQSALKAGFRPSYALNLAHLRPSWLSEAIENTHFDPEHIKQGIQKLATEAPDSRSPDDTRLKAYEILAKITGMIDNKNNTNIQVNVQPILGGESVKDRVIIDTPPTQ